MGEQSTQGVVAGDNKASEVGEELTTQVENNEEEVESAESDDGVGLGDTGRLLEVLENGVLGQLLRNGHVSERRSKGQMAPASASCH